MLLSFILPKKFLINNDQIFFENTFFSSIHPFFFFFFIKKKIPIYIKSFYPTIKKYEDKPSINNKCFRILVITIEDIIIIYLHSLDICHYPILLVLECISILRFNLFTFDSTS